MLSRLVGYRLVQCKYSKVSLCLVYSITSKTQTKQPVKQLAGKSLIALKTFFQIRSAKSTIKPTKYRTGPITSNQGLREKIFLGVRRLIPDPQILLGPPSLIGAHAVKSFLSDGCRSSFKSEGITIFAYS